MKFKSLSVGISLAIASALSVTTSAQAATTLFNFDTKVTYPGTPIVNKTICDSLAKCDILLNSVTIGSTTIKTTGLYTVTGAALIDNAPRTPDAPGATLDQMNTNNTGALSADKGDRANGVKMEDLPAETGANNPKFNTSSAERTIVASLGNFNMNNILDTEDEGYFTLDLLFGGGKTFNSLLLWERGMNSDLQVQAITGVGGNQATSFGDSQFLSRSDWKSAGYAIDTTEINQPQDVGSKGIRFSSAVQGVRLVSKKQFNGPDFKVVATQVPEPTTVASLGLVAGAMALSRRAKQKQQA